MSVYFLANIKIRSQQEYQKHHFQLSQGIPYQDCAGID
jgi:hypothetical protein